MATYTTPKNAQSVFNSSNYLDTTYLTKSEADDLYINELPESVEKLIGSINIVGDETVTNQYVTGNAVISGNLTTGQDGTSGTTLTNTVIKGNLTSGQDGSNGTTPTTTVIKGTVDIGDINNAGTVTRALGRVNLGWTLPINIRGQPVNINVETLNGTTSTMIGNGTGAITLNSTNVIVGNDNTSSVTQIRGKTIAIGNNPSDGGIQIGRGGLVANASGGQTNTFVSTQNKIFNPRLCDAWGNLLGQGFNLNNPSHFVFNQNLKYANSTYTYCDTSTVKNIQFFLNTPSLVTNQCYTMVFDFHYYLITGRGVSGGASVSTNTSALNTTYGTATASRVIQSQFALILAKSTASGGDGAYTFTYINMSQTANPFASFTHAGASSGNTTTALGFSKSADGRIRVNIQFPQMGTNTYSTSSDFMISMGCSLRLCNSNVNGTNLTGNGSGVYPSNSADSFGGSAFFSLS